MPGPRIWFDRPGVRWSRALLVAALGTAGFGLWQAGERGLWGEQGVAPAPRVAAAARPASVPLPPGLPGAEPRSGIATADAGSAPTTSRQVRVCGLGSVPVGPDGPDAAARRVVAVRAQPVLARWLEAMRAGGPAAKAAALALEPMSAEPPPLAASVWAAQRERIAEMAAASRDAGLLAVALQVCGVGSPAALGSACARLTAQDWIAADASHAEPWLLMAEQAHDGGDAEAAAEALRRAVTLPFGRQAEQALLAAVQAAQPADAGVLERLLMGEALLALRAGWREPYEPLAAAWCSVPAQAAAQRRESCQQLAEHLVLRGVTPAQVKAGRSLGERLGWFPERMTAAARDLDAAARLEAGFRGEEAWDCPALQRRLDHQHAVLAQGEVAALRRLAPATPRP